MPTINLVSYQDECKRDVEELVQRLSWCSHGLIPFASQCCTGQIVHDFCRPISVESSDMAGNVTLHFAGQYIYLNHDTYVGIICVLLS